MADFGNPVYNIMCVAESPHISNPIPLKLYDASVKVLEEAGLLGKHHVTEKGFFLDGFAEGIEKRITGTFEIHYRRGYTENAREMAEGIRKSNDFRPREPTES